MSNEPTSGQGDTSTTRGDAWGDPITDERQAELEAMVERWKTDPDYSHLMGPYVDEKLTGADVYWLIRSTYAEGVIRPGPNQAQMAISDGTYVGDEQHTAYLSGFLSARRTTQQRYSGDGAYYHNLRGADLGEAHLAGAQLSAVRLDAAGLLGADLTGTDLVGASLVGAQLGPRLDKTALFGADLRQASLYGADIIHTDLSYARLEGADLTGCSLSDVSVQGATFDKTTGLGRTRFVNVRLRDVAFDSANLSAIPWSSVAKLGEEVRARTYKGASWRAMAFRDASRTYRSLASALRTQGLSSEAARFHYRAELMGRYALLNDTRRRLFSFGFVTAPFTLIAWFTSWLLGTFAGYGDYLWRLFATYAAVVCGFAAAMFIASGRPVSADAIRDVLVLSVTSFHGRGIQPPGLHLDDLLATLAGAEAVFGLLIEGLFIAAFTRRVTGG